jgi:hypothetical protein
MLIEEMEEEFASSEAAMEQSSGSGSNSGGRVTQRVNLMDPSGLDQLKSWGVSVG